MSSKVSIITVVLNAAETVEDCIKSVCTQTHSDIEHIIIDGESTDGTIAIINRYKDELSKFVSENDSGIYDAMNKGIRLASGDIIAVLNSDDVYEDSTIVSQMVEFMANHNLDAAYGNLVYIDKDKPDKITRFWKAGKYKRGAFFHGWVPPHPTFFCRKKVFEKFGYFNDKFRVAADFELMLRFIERCKIKVGYLPKVIVKMRAGGRANVLRGIIRGNREIIKSFRLNGFRVSPWFFTRKPMEKIGQVLKKSKVTLQ